MKVLVSACIMGTNCKYNGKNNKNLAVINFLKDKEVISICPEVLAGMKIPRPCAEIVNGIVVDENGNDVNSEYNKAVSAVFLYRFFLWLIGVPIFFDFLRIRMSQRNSSSDRFL